MTQAPLQPQLKPWPPLLTAEKRPRWIIIRDLLLTLLAWGLLAWMLRDPIYVAYDFLRPPFFQLTTARPLDMQLLWHRLEIFLALSGALISMLFLSGVIDRHRLRAATHFPQPAALTDTEQAKQFKVNEFALLEAHHHRIIKVHYAENGSISRLEPVDFTRNTDVTKPAA